MMDQQVKTEVEEEPLPFTAAVLALPEQNGVTVAMLCPSPSPSTPYLGRDTELIEKRHKLKIKWSASDSKDKHEVSNHEGICGSFKKGKAAKNGLFTPDEVKSPAVIRAEELQSTLEPTFPCFMKPLVRSHVSSCFWMGLPGSFCKSRLPDQDTTITLEDECGKQFGIKYIANKTGLSAGWRQFSVCHNLLEGDVLIFQLVEPTKFKVYIIRANDLTEVDGALGLLNLDVQTKRKDAELDTVACKIAKKRRPKSFPLAIVQKKNKKPGLPRLVAHLRQPAEQSENDSEEVRSEVLEGFRLSMSSFQFKETQSFESFKIIINGLCIDSELSEDVRHKYYNLCCSQSAYLHDNLIEGINYKLIIGSISETVNIADALRSCNLTTTRDEFENWDKTLKAFELLGMNVGFLRARLHRHVNLIFESAAAVETRRYIEARTGRAHLVDEIRNLEARLMELKEVSTRYDHVIDSLKSKAESFELKFQEDVAAPW